MDNEKNIDKDFPDGILMSDLVTMIYQSYKNYLIYKIADTNITPGQIPFILELMHSKIASQDDLANKLLLTRGAAAKTLRKLDDDEIVERKRRIDNRRKYDVYLTDKGKEAASKIEKVDKTWENLILSNLEDLEDLSEFKNKETIVKLLKILAKASTEVFAEEIKKHWDLDNPDYDFEMLPFGEIPFRRHNFRRHHFKGQIFHENFFKRKSHE
ncbi:MAG: MarR family transcriptional regulator [Methanobrevibacter sp.]|jgi:DNA-binding MarR family transcriptional regulator|nr:MarR family transcriptional regulator [Candidatus Methanovirga australis]